jgi:hypothetical protein
MEDGDAKLNKNFIDDCLKRAIKELKRTDVADFVVSRDTQGAPGFVDIARLVLDRIDEAEVVVADVTIINPKTVRREGERPTPNPNVMFELGYAYKSKGHEAIIAVMNTASGGVEELPFDIKPKRLMTYNLTAPEHREAARPELVRDLVSALKLCLADTEERQVDRNSVLAEAAFLARLLGSEADAWSRTDLLKFAKMVETKLIDAHGLMDERHYSLVVRNLTAKAVNKLRRAMELAPTDENWPQILAVIADSKIDMDLVFQDLGLKPHATMIIEWNKSLRDAPTRIIGVLDELAKEPKLEHLKDLEALSWELRRIALGGADPAHPALAKELDPLTLKFRVEVIRCLRDNHARINPLRSIADEFEGLVKRYPD